MMTAPTEPESALRLGTWIRDKRGYYTPKVRFQPDPFGFSVVANEYIAPDTTIVTCPFNLAITKSTAKTALVALLRSGDTTVLDQWTERQCIASYLVFHRILGELDCSSKFSRILQHGPYVEMLPSADKMRTGLHLTPEERELFKGSNLFGAIDDREKDCRSEWSECAKVIASSNSGWAEAFTWELYLTATTHITSRAFPSTLLSNHPSLQSSSSTEPVLLPGIDSLNHGRGKAVSWTVSYPTQEVLEKTVEEPCISLIVHYPVLAGGEVLNNYGAKPNSELILGYGFSLSENPEDTILLKVGGSASDTKRWEIGRSARGMDGLWAEILSLAAQRPDPTYEDQLDASGILSDMVEALINRLPPGKRDFDPSKVRPDVVKMYQDYIEGQRDILDSVLRYAKDKEEEAIERAREEGVELIFED
ncbi:lysine methyltransferase [Moniliophthora roreri MCA 2997]|uniref:Lysine methyltransferase n=1 Tax=Moniliophthora roreri (strain MCA 2997) TaxID=1381753 RepID=V2YYU0_MONRO|nr:lysine methyltransferase [Moniliophthora roreri MCA 2997]